MYIDAIKHTLEGKKDTKIYIHYYNNISNISKEKRDPKGRIPVTRQQRKAGSAGDTAAKKGGIPKAGSRSHGSKERQGPPVTQQQRKAGSQRQDPGNTAAKKGRIPGNKGTISLQFGG